MPIQPLQFKSFLKGVNASVDRTNQPQGSVPRASNLILTRRGALITCDGSQILHAFDGVPTAGRGKCMANFLFAPTGVPRYYVSLFKVLDIPLGAPANLSVVTAAGGSLAAHTYYYVVTAIDGVGGETTISNEVSQVTPLNNKNTLTWNVVPNAVGYNIYRGTAPGGELLLIGADMPVVQAVPGSLTQSYIDTGADPTSEVFNVVQAIANVVTTNKLTGPAQRWIYSVTFTLNSTAGLHPGMTFVYIPGSDVNFGTVTWTISSVPDGTHIIAGYVNHTALTAVVVGTTTTGGTFTATGPFPVIDTTQQTALYKMPPIIGSPAVLPVSYNNDNIIAFFPADPPIVDGGGGGGTGGSGVGGGSSGGTGAGATGGGTPSGGIPMNLSFIPEMVQFSNRVCIALGNGFPLQILSDPATSINNATQSVISAISVDAFGVVTVTVVGGHGIPTGGDGANVFISGVPAPFGVYNGTFTTLQIVSPTVFKVRNLAAIGTAGTAGGFVTTTTIPVLSNFVQPFPAWATGVTYLVGDIVVPTTPNGHYYKCIQAGVSAAGEPTFPTGLGQQVAESTPSAIIWQEAGLTNSTAPPPPGAGHIKVFAGSLWVWNTSYSNTTNGLDGPTCLRMSDSNNPNSWNPINQAFLDKDDGQEGSGLNAFTISGFGIPPEGSLVAFKQYAGYQIVGVFGSPNFLIQRIKSDLGCIAPRTIQFTTGFGLTRFSHLGFAIFDGINDRVIDEDIHPYIFPSDDIGVSDITTVDFNWVGVAWAAQTAHPPMYVAAFPIGESGGALTRIFCYDLVLKVWAIVDLPFRISTIAFAITNIAVPVTVMGSFNDGTLHRWQAGDQQWDNSIDTPGPSDVAWSVETPTVYNQRSQGGRIYIRQMVTTGKITQPDATINVNLELQGEVPVTADTTIYKLGQMGDFTLDAPINNKVTEMDAVISGTGAIELSSFNFKIQPEADLVPPILDQGRS